MENNVALGVATKHFGGHAVFNRSSCFWAFRWKAMIEISKSPQTTCVTGNCLVKFWMATFFANISKLPKIRSSRRTQHRYCVLKRYKQICFYKLMSRNHHFLGEFFQKQFTVAPKLTLYHYHIETECKDSNINTCT